MEVNGKDILVVAGGDGKSYLDSVELLDPTSNQGWKKGTEQQSNNIKFSCKWLISLNFKKRKLKFQGCIHFQKGKDA